MEGLGVRQHTWPGVVLAITGIFVIMAAVALRRLNWVRGGWLTVAGTLTYSLYLLHQSIGYAVIARLHDRIPRWPLLVGLIMVMLMAAWLVHRFVERPLAPRLRRALTTGLPAASTGTSADQRPRRSG
jgi:peptidoglycan/LPS O-acetylase OafA/YrhL